MNNPKKKKLKYDDEVCQCGHSKGYHEAHTIDKHGNGCEVKGCQCGLYTWKKFVKYVDVK